MEKPRDFWPQTSQTRKVASPTLLIKMKREVFFLCWAVHICNQGGGQVLGPQAPVLTLKEHNNMSRTKDHPLHHKGAISYRGHHPPPPGKGFLVRCCCHCCPLHHCSACQMETCGEGKGKASSVQEKPWVIRSTEWMDILIGTSYILSQCSGTTSCSGMWSWINQRTAVTPRCLLHCTF